MAYVFVFAFCSRCYLWYQRCSTTNTTEMTRSLSKQRSLEKALLGVAGESWREQQSLWLHGLINSKEVSRVMHYSLRELINFHTCPGPCNYTAQKCYPSLSKAKGTNSGQSCKGVLFECRDAKISLIAALHYLCRSLSVASASIVTILLAYNSFLYTQATGRLA